MNDAQIKKLSYLVGDSLEAISQSDLFFPIYGCLDSTETIRKKIFVGQTTQKATNDCQYAYDKNEENSGCGVIIKDERLDIKDYYSGDALIAQFKEYSSGDIFEVAIFYSSLASDKGFKIRQLSILDMSNYEVTTASLLFESFIFGITQHNEGSRLINEAFEPL